MSEFRSVVTGDGSRTPEEVIQRFRATVRRHFGMDIAYLSEFVDGRAIFRAVDAPGLEDMIKPGDSQDLRGIHASMYSKVACRDLSPTPAPCRSREMRP